MIILGAFLLLVLFITPYFLRFLSRRLLVSAKKRKAKAIDELNKARQELSNARKRNFQEKFRYAIVKLFKNK